MYKADSTKLISQLSVGQLTRCCKPCDVNCVDVSFKLRFIIINVIHIQADSELGNLICTVFDLHPKVIQARQPVVPVQPLCHGYLPAGFVDREVGTVAACEVTLVSL